MDTSVVFTLIGVVGTICSVLFGYIGYQRGLKKEVKSEGYDDGANKSDMEYIKRRIDDVLLEQKESNKNMNIVTERLTRVEESDKQAHKRLDELTNKNGGK
jgi:hypothetical protein